MIMPLQTLQTHQVIQINDDEPVNIEVPTNELNYEKRSDYVCHGTVVQDYCKSVLKKENGYNKEGLKIATNTVITKVVDIYKDYMKSEIAGNLLN